jgi:hypothetical protein
MRSRLPFSFCSGSVTEPRPRRYIRGREQGRAGPPMGGLLFSNEKARRNGARRALSTWRDVLWENKEP